MAVTVNFIGTVVNNGIPVAGTFKVASTTTSAGVSCPISPSGGVKVALSVSYGDTLTFNRRAHLGKKSDYWRAGVVE